MATWDEVRAHARGRWHVDQDSPQSVSLRFEVPAAGQKTQQVIGVAPTQVEGIPWLSAITELFFERDLSPRGALVYADRLLFGAIVLRDDRYLLRTGMALPSLTLAMFDWHVEMLAREAVRLRVNLLGRSPDGAVRAFDNYSE
jgi:hypothetical protein